MKNTENYFEIINDTVRELLLEAEKHNGLIKSFSYEYNINEEWLFKLLDSSNLERIIKHFTKMPYKVDEPYLKFDLENGKLFANPYYLFGVGTTPEDIRLVKNKMKNRYFSVKQGMELLKNEAIYLPNFMELRYKNSFNKVNEINSKFENIPLAFICVGLDDSFPCSK